MPIAALTPSLRYLFKTRRQGWEMVIREQALRSSREQRKSLYITSKSDKKHMEIKLWGSSKFVPSPCPSDKEHGPGNLGREACMWKATYRGCCQQHSEMKTSICQEYMFLLWLIWFQIYRQLVVWTLGLQLQAAHSEWYHFFCSPLLRCCESCLSEVQMCCSFLDGDLVLQMFSLVPWPYLCVFWFFKSWLIQNQDWFAGFLVSCCFSTLHSCFGGVSPLPAFLSQILIPGCMLAGQPAMWFEVRFVVSSALPAAKS